MDNELEQYEQAALEQFNKYKEDACKLVRRFFPNTTITIIDDGKSTPSFDFNDLVISSTQRKTDYTKPVFVIAATVRYPGDRYEPPGMDLVELETLPDFLSAINRAIIIAIEREIDIMFEEISTRESNHD